MLRNAAPYLRRHGKNGLAALQKRAFASQDVRNAKEVPQAEAKGKPASEAPMTPSAWKGTQRGHLVLGISGVLCAGALYSWVSSQKADKQLLMIQITRERVSNSLLPVTAE